MLSLALQSCGSGTRQAAMCQACDRIDISSGLIGRDRCRWSHVLNDITRSDRTFPSLFIFQTEASSLLIWSAVDGDSLVVVRHLVSS